MFRWSDPLFLWLLAAGFVLVAEAQAQELSFKQGFETPNGLTITSNVAEPIHQLPNQVITFTFESDVTGFDVADIMLRGAVAGTFTPVSDSVYTLALTGLGGSVIVSVPIGAASVISDGTPTKGGLFKNFYQDTPQISLPGGVPLHLVRVPGGTFNMGSPEDELSRNDDETLHQVTLSRDYYMGLTELTQEQWLAVMGSFPLAQEHGLDDDLAVHNVSWEDITDPATGFVRLLNDHIEATGQPFEVMLPTEAQWEYAARAGTTTRFSFGDGFSSDDLCTLGGGREDHMWYCGNAGSSTQLVGQKFANPWGLQDMHGNVDEWCADGDGPYPTEPVTDPTGSDGSPTRVFRGGNWGGGASKARSAARNATTPGSRSFTRGLRIAASRPATLGITSNRGAVHQSDTQRLTFTLDGGGFASFDGSQIAATGATKGAFGPFNPPDSIFYTLDLDNTGGTVTIDIAAGAAIPFAPYTTSRAATFSNFYQDTWTLQLRDLDGEPVTMEMIRIPAGTFMMGAPEGELSAGFIEMPQNEVTIDDEFYMSKTEVTQDQYESVRSIQTVPPFITAQTFVGGGLPVHNISYNDIQDGGSGSADGFMDQLWSHLIVSGQGTWDISLPSEAQWEYAARAGTTTRFSFGDGFSTNETCALGGGRDEHMWFCGNASSTLHEVGTKLPNPWGLYDMHGNAAEWTNDLLRLYEDGTPLSGYAVRGGSYISHARAMRSAARASLSATDKGPNTGFRVVIVP